MVFFFVLFGLKKKAYPVRGYYQHCDRCGKETPHRGAIVKKAITLFFIPVIPLGSSKMVECTRCVTRESVSLEEYFANIARASKGSAGVPPPGPALNAPFCPMCGTKTVYVRQYGRWFCRKCQKYV